MNSCIVVCPFIADEIEDPSSPVHCFIPISSQHDSAIDYHHQFHVATPIRQNPTQNAVRERRKKWKQERSMCVQITVSLSNIAYCCVS
jgi:hypothetical protein